VAVEAWVIDPPVDLVAATGPAVVEPAPEAAMSRAAVVVAEGGMLSEEVRADSMERARAPIAAAAPPAWDREAAEASVAVAAAVVAGGAGNRHGSQQGNHRSTDMRATSANASSSGLLCIGGAVVCACLFASGTSVAQQSAGKKVPATATVASGVAAKGFSTPQQAADEVVDAAAKFDVDALEQIFGSDGKSIVLTGEVAQDRERAADFAAKAQEKKSVSLDPKSKNRATLVVGDEDWPFPVPMVKRGNKWFFDAKAGQKEMLYRRIGANELDAIAISHNYVEAQHDYALQKREGYAVNQYAQRIVSTPGKKDGLAWQNPDGTWGGPIGEEIAHAIEQGYTSRAEPYHGYFFKILKGQGPAAPLGAMDYVVKGVMIGGFALVAAPAEYAVTGVKTFIVSNDGVVYQKDFGPASLGEFKKMDRFNPDKSWTPVLEKNE
jgi:Protein of unknown function (DUF2950)